MLFLLDELIEVNSKFPLPEIDCRTRLRHKNAHRVHEVVQVEGRLYVDYQQTCLTAGASRRLFFGICDQFNEGSPDLFLGTNRHKDLEFFIAGSDAHTVPSTKHAIPFDDFFLHETEPAIS